LENEFVFAGNEANKMALEASYESYKAMIPEWRVREVLAKLIRLSETAQKLGLPAFDISTEEAVLRPCGEPGGIQKARFVPVTVIGGAPVIQGWKFLAKIEHDDGGNEVKGIGAQNAVEKDPKLFDVLTQCEPDCQHCDLKRKRNTTYFFEKGMNDDIERIQVGSSCVEDFSGHDNPGRILQLASGFIEIINEIQDEDGMSLGGGSSGNSAFEVKDILAIAAALVRVDGRWISRSASEERGGPSSGDMVTNLACNPKERMKLVEDEDCTRAERVEAWLLSEEFDPGTNLYLHNLQKMAHRGYVQFNAIGFLGSAIATWSREQDQKKVIEKQQVNSVKIGEEGEQLKCVVEVQKIIPIDTEFGVSRLHIMEEKETGAKVTWFSSGQRKFMVGDSYEIKGRVKGYRQKDGVWETKLSRVTSPDLALHNKIDPSMDEPGLIKKIKKMSNLNARDGDGETLIQMASHLYSYRQVGKGLISALIEKGANPGIRGERDERTAVDYWVQSEDAELIGIAVEQFPETLSEWTDELLKNWGLFDKEWVPEFRSARDKVAAKVESVQPIESPGGEQPQGKMINRKPKRESVNLVGGDDTELDEADDLKLA
jgi:hypothetical protein